MKEVNYEELELLVKAYQDGSSDASNELVKRFDGYFKKFLNVLSGHRFIIDDRTQRHFVSLFVQDEETRNNVKKFKQSPHIRKVLNAVVRDLRDGLAHLSREELYHEMIIIFLTLAKDHNHSAPLNKYIGRVFHYRLFDRIIKLFNVQKEIDSQEGVYYEEMPEASHNDDIDFDGLDKTRYLISPQNATEYDENWVNGYTSDDMFQGLTTYERRLLKLYYEWKTIPTYEYEKDVYLIYKERFKRTEQDIADLLGCSRKTVNLKRNKIKSRLEPVAFELNLLRPPTDE